MYTYLYICVYMCVCLCVWSYLYVYTLSGILLPRTWPCGGGGRTQERGVGVSGISCHGSMYICSMMLSVSRTVSLSLSQAFVQQCTHPISDHSTIHSFYFSFSYVSSLSLSLWRVRASVRAVPFSFFLSLSPLHSLSGFLSVSFFLFYTNIWAHAVTRSLSSTHSQTYTRTKSLSRSCSLTHTPFSLSFSLSLFLSLSLLHIYTDTHTLIHTHIRTHTFFHLFTCSSTHSLLSRVRAALSLARVRARALFSLFRSPFLLFLFFSFVILSLLLPSSPLDRLLPCRLSLTRLFPFFLNSW